MDCATCFFIPVRSVGNLLSELILNTGNCQAIWFAVTLHVYYTTCKYQKSVKMTTHFRQNIFMQLKIMWRRGQQCRTKRVKLYKKKYYYKTADSKVQTVYALQPFFFHLLLLLCFYSFCIASHFWHLRWCIICFLFTSTTTIYISSQSHGSHPMRFLKYIKLFYWFCLHFYTISSWPNSHYTNGTATEEKRLMENMVWNGAVFCIHNTASSYIDFFFLFR